MDIDISNKDEDADTDIKISQAIKTKFLSTGKQYKRRRFIQETDLNNDGEA